MRAHKFAPSFDSLDGRLLLSASGATTIAGTGISGAAATSTSANSAAVPITSDEVDVVGSVDWYLEGNPTSPVYDPSAPTITGTN